MNASRITFITRTRLITATAMTIALLAGSFAGAAAQDGEVDPLSSRFFRLGDTGSSIRERGSEACGVRAERDADLTRAFYLCEGTFESKDPRLNGRFYLLLPERTPQADGTGRVNGDKGVIVHRLRVAITNDDGRWVGVYTWMDTTEPFLAAAEGATNRRQRQKIEANWQASTATMILEGQGAYEGLTAYIDMVGPDGDEHIGLIFPGEMPPLAGEVPKSLESTAG